MLFRWFTSMSSADLLTDPLLEFASVDSREPAPGLLLTIQHHRGLGGWGVGRLPTPPPSPGSPPPPKGLGQIFSLGPWPIKNDLWRL